LRCRRERSFDRLRNRREERREKTGREKTGREKTGREKNIIKITLPTGA
jgi:hypothetical protein